jgi:hypothetical protein
VFSGVGKAVRSRDLSLNVKSMHNSTVYVEGLRQNQTKHREIGGSHGGDYEEYCLLGCDAVYSPRNSPTFRRNATCFLGRVIL